MTQGLAKAWLTSLFLLTHPVWDVTRIYINDFQKYLISTHTSRVGCDGIHARTTVYRQKNFYSHIPCGMWPQDDNAWVSGDAISTHTSRVGCDKRNSTRTTHAGFLLTHPVWDVTLSDFSIDNVNLEFLLTHPVWDVTDWVAGEVLPSIRISTHTSRVGCDFFLSCCCTLCLFLLTHPVWDVTPWHLQEH